MKGVKKALAYGLAGAVIVIGADNLIQYGTASLILRNLSPEEAYETAQANLDRLEKSGFLERTLNQGNKLACRKVVDNHPLP